MDDIDFSKLERLGTEVVSVDGSSKMIDVSKALAYEDETYELLSELLSSLFGCFCSISVDSGVHVSQYSNGSSDLKKAANNAKNVSSVLIKQNVNLANEWDNVYEHALELENSMSMHANEMLSVINNFINISKQNEREIFDAVEKANSIAESILARLNKN